MRANRITRTALSVVVAFASIAAVAADQQTAAPRPSGLYALSSYAGLTLMSGTQVVTRVAVDEGDEPGSLGFTQDNRFAYLAEYDYNEPDASAILSVDVRAHTSFRVRCNCRTITAAGGSTVAWFDGRGNLWQANLAAQPTRPSRRAVRLPSVPGPDPYPYVVLAGDDGALVVATHPIAPITPQPPITPELLIINSAGQVGRLRTPPQAFADHPVAVWPGADGPGPSVAVVVPSPPSGCAHVGVDLINPYTGHLTTTDTNPTGAGADASEVVDDLWWGADATLYAAVALSPCHGDPSKQQHRIWRLTNHAWHAIGPDMVVDARQTDASTTVAALGVDASTLYVSSSFSAVPTGSSMLEMATPTPSTMDPAMALRLGSNPCTRPALARRSPRFLDSASVTTYACNGGYAYAQYEQAFGTTTVTRGQLLAAIGPDWQVIATGTAWDGRILDQDFRYAGLDVAAFRARFPQADEPIQYTAPDMSGLVGLWNLDPNGSSNSGHMAIATDAHAHLTYRIGDGPEHHVTLLFVRTTRDSALALVTVSDDPAAPLDNWFKFVFGPTSLQLYKPHAYSDLYNKAS